MFTRVSLLSALAILVAACGGGGGGDKNPVGPDADCNKGALTLGATKAGTVSSSDCTFAVTSPAKGHYDAYTAALVAGRVYQVRFEATNEDSVDAYVEVIEPGGVGIALSDDNLFSYNSELFFIAPTTGTYSIRAGGLNSLDRGGYTLTLSDCNATTITSTSAVAGTLSTSDCTTRYSIPAAGNAADVFLFTYTGTEQTVTMTSSAAAPLFTVGGQGFLSLESNFIGLSNLGSPATLVVPAGEATGTFLIVVSAEQPVTADRPYTIQVGPSASVASVSRQAGWPSRGVSLGRRKG